MPMTLWSAEAPAQILDGIAPLESLNTDDCYRSPSYVLVTKDTLRSVQYLRRGSARRPA